MSYDWNQYKLYGSGAGMDYSVDDLVSEDNSNGFGWDSLWDTLSTNAGSVFDSSLDAGKSFYEGWLGNQLTEKDGNHTDNTNSTLDSNASTSQGNISRGMNIDTNMVLMGGGFILGAIVLIKLL